MTDDRIALLPTSREEPRRVCRCSLPIQGPSTDTRVLRRPLSLGLTGNSAPRTPSPSRVTLRDRRTDRLCAEAACQCHRRREGASTRQRWHSGRSRGPYKVGCLSLAAQLTRCSPLPCTLQATPAVAQPRPSACFSCAALKFRHGNRVLVVSCTNTQLGGSRKKRDTSQTMAMILSVRPGDTCAAGTVQTQQRLRRTGLHCSFPGRGRRSRLDVSGAAGAGGVSCCRAPAGRGVVISPA